MLRCLFAVIALVVVLPMAAVADDPRGNADAALSGTWKLTWFFYPVGRTTGAHYVQVYSDRRVHWTDSVHSTRVYRPELDGKVRCEDSTELSAGDFAAMRDVARSVYDLQLQDHGGGLGDVFLNLIVSREGRNYIAGAVNYPPALGDLDPRLKRVQAIFARFACARPES